MTGSGAPVPHTNFQVPNEYFHTVPLEMLWVAEGFNASIEEVKAAPKWASGTGFFYRAAGYDFIVTAQHNFSGRNWETNEFQSPRSVAPTHVKVAFRVEPPDGEFNANELGVSDWVFRLVDKDENPLWLEHPQRGREVDIAVLAFEKPAPNLHIVPLTPEVLGSDPRFWITQDVFIAGYPFGLDTGFVWPLWTRGTVASEPAVHFTYKGREYPFFLVDARTRTGQSGSPVFLLRRPFHEIASDDAPPRSRLLGIYTGRINLDNRGDSDLGFVWHIGEVDRICAGSTRGSKQ